MPLYDYTCPECGASFEAMRAIEKRAFAECPECGATSEREISGGKFMLRGYGWSGTSHGSTNGARDLARAKKF